MPLDNQLAFILRIASGVDSKSTHSLSTRRVKSGDTVVWQIALVQDRGDRSGPFFFVQGEGDTLDEAAEVLLKRLQTMLQERHVALTEEARKSAVRYEAEVQSLWAALEKLSEPR